MNCGSSGLEIRLQLDVPGNGHFVVECVHDAGHAEPPLETVAAEGGSSDEAWRPLNDGAQAPNT